MTSRSMKLSPRIALCGLVLLAVSCGGMVEHGPFGRQANEALEDEVEKADPGGIGSIETRNERGETGKLALARVSVEAKQAGDVAEVEVKHVFTSSAEVALEGTFRFPMPEGAIVTGLAMRVDGKMIEGELVENDKARKIYEEIVDAMQDPVLMEWEHGTTFKMRVFPIEPQTEKVVSMRYLVPLRKKGTGYVFTQGTRAIDDGEALAALDVNWNGRRIFDERNVPRSRVIEAAASTPPSSIREATNDSVYSVVRVVPNWAAVPALAAAPPKNWVVVVDTSRSSLEERKLALETLRTLTTKLGKGSRFVVATSDLETHVDSAGFKEVSALAIDDAVRFVEKTAPDGATNLSEMLRVVSQTANAAGNAGILYVGDCEASWGETNPRKLGELASRLLPGIPLHPVLLGSSVDPETARELANATLGRVVRARTPLEVDSFVASLSKAPKRITRAELAQIPGSVVLPTGTMTLEEGDEVVAYVRTPKDAQVPTAVTLHGFAKEKAFDTTVPVNGTNESFVARRFGSEWVHELERARKPKEEIVQASIAFSVMSKHTSFLVLESEEAYEKHAIDRRSARANARVAGLDALDTSGVDISLARIQPGDPEISIDAPRDAAHVFVEFPDGEVKVASFDPEAREGRGAWMVRFLVAKETPEGSYEARAFIESASGEREVRTVHYSVDTTSPTLEVRLEPLHGKPGSFVVLVTQKAAKNEVDTRRVEVSTPDGQILLLTAVRWGEFRAVWTPTRAVAGETLHVVGFDQALNHASVDVRVP